MTYIIALFSLSALCVLWVIFQGWLAKTDKDYKGYKAGCGGCSRSCGESETKHNTSECDPAAECDPAETKVTKTQVIDTSSLSNSSLSSSSLLKDDHH